MIRRPPRSTLSSSSAASDVYKRQAYILKFPFMFKVVRSVRYFDHFYFVFINKVDEFLEHIPDNECFEQSASKIRDCAGFLIKCNFLFKSRSNQRSAETKFHIIGVPAANGHEVFCFPDT